MEEVGEEVEVAVVVEAESGLEQRHLAQVPDQEASPKPTYNYERLESMLINSTSAPPKKTLTARTRL